MRSLRFIAIAALLCTACGGMARPSELQPGASTAASASAAPDASAATPDRSATPADVAGTASPAVATSVPTRAASAQPTATARTNAYTTLSPGSALPTEQQCAIEIVRDTWEPRPDNRAANQSNAWTSGFRLHGSYLGSIAASYEQRVTGNFTGTTDQILRWGACKWGFDENDVRAQVVIESYWHQSTLGDCNKTTQPETKGCASVGLLQVQGANIPATHPGTWPAAMTSTAFNVDYALAVRRLCYEGKETWMRQSYSAYAAGDLWGCIGRWYSGRWHDAGAETYITRVRATLNARTWLSSSF